MWCVGVTSAQKKNLALNPADLPIIPVLSTQGLQATSGLPIPRQSSPSNKGDTASHSHHHAQLLKISDVEDVLRQAGLSPGRVLPFTYKHMCVKCTLEV